jgi:hypothetical protein
VNLDTSCTYVCTLFMYDLNLLNVPSIDLSSLCMCALELQLLILYTFQMVGVMLSLANIKN